MIIWVNGAFGSGKTTVARHLQTAIDGSHIVNVEKVGTMVRQTVPPPLSQGDFQDDPIFRQTVVLALSELDRRNEAGSLIVPMTVVEPKWFQEIMSGLRSNGLTVCHVALLVDASELRRRIRKGIYTWPPTPPRWRRANVERCTRALQGDIFRHHVDDNRPPRAIARDIYVIATSGE